MDLRGVYHHGIQTLQKLAISRMVRSKKGGVRHREPTKRDPSISPGRSATPTQLNQRRLDELVQEYLAEEQKHKQVLLEQAYLDLSNQMQEMLFVQQAQQEVSEAHMAQSGDRPKS